MNVLIVGGGAMGQAFVKGLSSPGNNYECAVVEKQSLNSTKVKGFGVKVFGSVDEVGLDPQWSQPGVCVIAVKPIDVASVGTELKKWLPNECVIISIAAGMSIASLHETFNKYPVVRAMPNIAASKLMSATAICSADEVTETQLQNAREVLDTLGSVVRVSEEKMNLVTAISGSGPAYFFLLAELMIEAAKQNGMSVEIAHKLVSQTFRGAAAMVEESGSFSSLRKLVTSPGGTTQAAIETMDSKGFGSLVSTAIAAAMSRSYELDAGDAGKQQ